MKLIPVRARNWPSCIAVLPVWALLLSTSCMNVHKLASIPEDSYWMSARDYARLSNQSVSASGRGKIKVDIEQSDSSLALTPISGTMQALEKDLSDITSLKVYRNTFDLDVMTIPFKVRPATDGFPHQLNPNFSAALYMGRRRDIYHFKRDPGHRDSRARVTGAGFGYGGFAGVGAVTMNPFVTNSAIDYDYDGFVVSAGAAAIFDAKKFNLGLALGADYLTDANSKHWIYQGKPWLGFLFGINLN